MAGTEGLANAETWDGSSWSEVADLNTGRESIGVFGVQGSAICAGGEVTSPSYAIIDSVESWDGSSWTELADMNTNAMRRGGAGSSNTEGILIGGSIDPPVTANTEQWNGSSWTEVANLATARFSARGTSGGTASTAALAVGGHPPNLVNTEEWDVSTSAETIAFD